MALAGKSTEQHSNIAPATIGPAGVSTAMPAFFGQGRVFTKGGGGGGWRPNSAPCRGVRGDAPPENLVHVHVYTICVLYLNMLCFSLLA